MEQYYQCLQAGTRFCDRECPEHKDTCLERLSEAVKYQEGRIDALLDEIDGRDRTIRDLDATCAAMRWTLEQIFWRNPRTGRGRRPCVG